MNKYYITTPIYYVNSKPHIGHAYTTIVADILARYYRQKLGNNNVWFLTGTDEHGAKIAQAAEKEGIDPQAFTDNISALFKDTWTNLNISNDDFIRTTESRHETVVKEILLKLKEAKTPKGNDFIYSGDYEGLYCVGCEAYKKEDDLVDGKCPDHNKVPELLKEKNWYIRLSDYAEVLKDKIANDEIKILPVDRKSEVLSFIEQGLEDVAISRQQVKWGIPVPFDEDQTIYVWVDALLNYISALGYPNDEKFKKFWPANTQLLAKDILKFHAIIWPAMLLAAGIEPPKELFIHGYFTIDGKKMSKTLGNVIDPNDLVAEFGVDAARYLIVSQFPFGQDGDVKADEFKIKYNADLANGIGNLVSRVISMAEKYCDNKIPGLKYTASFDLGKIWQTVEKNYQDYKVYENLKEIWSLISWADNYIAETTPWAKAKEGKSDEVNQIIYNLLELLKQLAGLVSPILPQTSTEIFKRLNFVEATLENIKTLNSLNCAASLDKGEALFLRK